MLMINLQSKIKSRQKKGNLGLHLQNEGRKAGLKVLNIDAGLTLEADPHQDTDHPKAIDTYPHSENLQGDGVILKKRREAHLIEREAHHQERKEAHHQGTEGGVHLQEKGGVLPGKGGAHLLGNAGAHLQGDGIALLLVGGEVHLLGKGEAFLQGQLVVLHLEGGQAHMQENGLDHHLVHWTDGLDEEDHQVQVLCQVVPLDHLQVQVAQPSLKEIKRAPEGTLNKAKTMNLQRLHLLSN